MVPYGTDWRETLEHMGDWQGEELVFTLPANASAAAKARRVQRNTDLLHEQLLDDGGKWQQLLHHLNQLPE